MKHFKLSSIFLAVALIIAPVALHAQDHHNAPKWTGVHVGVIGGTAAGNYNIHATDGTDSEDFNSALAGGRVGVQGGIDFNVKGLVVGAVADWSWSNAKFKFGESAFVSGSGSNSFELKSTVKQITTFRARVGKRYGHVLPYVHGGLLLADTKLEGNANLSGSGGSLISESHVHPGFVVGAGFEYAVARHYSLSTEYGYNHAGGDVATSLLGTSSPGVSITENPHFSTITVGVNYRF